MYAIHDFPVQLPNDSLKGLLFPQDITDIGFFFLDQFSILPANENWHYWSLTLDRLSGEHLLQPEELSNDHIYLYSYVETNVVGPNFPKTQTLEIQCLLFIPTDFLTKDSHYLCTQWQKFKVKWSSLGLIPGISTWPHDPWNYSVLCVDWKYLAFCCY